MFPVVLGQTIFGPVKHDGNALTVVEAAALLLGKLGSPGEVAETVATFVSVPLVVLSTLTTNWTVASDPAFNEVKVTVRLLPEPPQLAPAPPVALHETKVVPLGRLSVTTNDCA